MASNPNAKIPSPSAPTWQNWSGNLVHKPASDGGKYYFAPTNLTATQTTQANLFDGSAIVLSWQNSDANCEVDIVVERCTDGVNFQPAITVGPNQGSIVDGFLNSGTRYFYRLRGQSTGDESGPVQCRQRGGAVEALINPQ